MSKNINKKLINKIRTILLIKTSEEKFSDNNFKINSKTIKEINEKYDINNIEITINNPQISGFKEKYYGNKCCSLKEVNFFLFDYFHNQKSEENNENENSVNSLNNSDKLHLRKKYVVHGENGKEKKLEEKINNNNKTEIIAIRFLKNLAKKFIDVDLIKSINKKNCISFKDSKLKKLKENFDVEFPEKINKSKPKIKYLNDENKITKTKTFVNLIDQKQKFFLFKQNNTLLSEIKHRRRHSKSNKKVKKKTLKKIRQNNEFLELKQKESTDDETIDGKIN